ncbi:MAG: NAD(P)-dependent oxidoreductase [Aphanocapsa sp. GSE-SYN-MK-11-07L]|jgi:nucleoside-diphosphate-sugar epimerase|nr:NAD(P)-dependent oxidoreductase [Aphanocapsa sp. GSE-SYN-MK-11-07L]
MDLQSKTLLITGIGDFIGRRAAEMALERGMKVLGLEFSPEKAQLAEELGATVHIGSTNDELTLVEACQGADIVFHTVSKNDASGAIDSFRAINVEGTIKTATAAKQAGAKVFIHLSSVLVYGFHFPNCVTEDQPLVNQKNPFCQTKIESEQEVLKLNHADKFGIIVIRAGDVYGPGGSVWVMQPLSMMQKKKFVLVNGGRGICNHIYIDNLIDGVFLAVEKEAYGEAFNLTDGGQTTWREYYECLAEIGGYPKPVISVPALAAKTALRQMGKKADLLPESIDFVTRSHAYSIEKATRLLGYQPRIDLAKGMERTADWLSKNNLVN